MVSGVLPYGNDPNSLSHVLWELTDRAYRRSSPAYLNVKTNTAVRAEEEDPERNGKKLLHGTRSFAGPASGSGQDG